MIRLRPVDPEHALGTVVAAVLVLNLLDLVLTMVWVLTGMGVEGNPAMAPLIRAHPLLFVSVKLALVGLGSALLWRLRHEPLAVIGLFCLFLVYYAILVLHLRLMGLRFWHGT